MGPTRSLRALDKTTARRITDRCKQLARDPMPPEGEMVKSLERWRIRRVRVGDFRILYQLQDDMMVVLVARIVNRNAAYDKKLLDAIKRALRQP